MTNIILWNIILLEIALGWYFYMWTYEILNICYTVIVYLNITLLCTLWLMHFGSKSYSLEYRKSGDEPDVYRIIKFPSIGQ